MSELHPRAELRALLRDHAVLHGNFTLSSGQQSDLYVDARRVTLSSRGSFLVALVFLEELEHAQVDAVAGLSIGADPIVSAITAVAGSKQVSIDGLIVRKERKAHGAGRRIEGPFRKGMRVAIVDDTLTTGSSSLEAARAIEDEGAVVSGVYALIDRGQGASEAVISAGYSFKAFFRLEDLLGSWTAPEKDASSF